MRFWRGWGSAWINKNTNEVSGSTHRDLHYVLGCAIGLASWLETGTWLIWPIQSDGGENPVKARYYGTTLQNHPIRCVWKYPPFQKKHEFSRHHWGWIHHVRDTDTQQKAPAALTAHGHGAWRQSSSRCPRCMQWSSAPQQIQRHSPSCPERHLDSHGGDPRWP